ncbi:hypothetical protein [Nostoc sp. PCC 7107]|uniref:hypothetical protein n=1 Tax=Nostoc sp. PCC 7107 TaxID=317936 RepID=UPI00029F3349|nr:hypothetical protein [Nostoc sp. PCC 7107]AFY42729.1 hypothetical protein Nos7107_2107 [Nostoc sp. PCC 7107]
MPKSLDVGFRSSTQPTPENPNDEKAFQAAMEVLISHRNPANRYPYLFELENPIN